MPAPRESGANARAAARYRRVAVDVGALSPTGGGEAEGEEWLTTYLDIMTLLLVFLVVMLALAGRARSGTSQGESAPAGEPSDAGVASAEADAEELSRMFGGLPFEHLGGNVEVVVTERSVAFRIDSESLFESGRSDLSLTGLASLQQLLPLVQANELDVTVEGHTDSRPISNRRFPSNWELSGARAGSVVRYLTANGIASSRIRAVGFADTHPLADNESSEGRARNRRVELIISRPAPRSSTSDGPQPGPSDGSQPPDAAPELPDVGARLRLPPIR
jgi:chemotaxis protein MotB